MMGRTIEYFVQILRSQIWNRKTALYNSGVRNITTNASSSQEDKINKSNETHFGFQTVKDTEKPGKVHKVFEDVAKSYDLMNDAMSLGIHRVWKDVFIERLAPTYGTKLLDMAGGTGDIAFRYIKYLQNELKSMKNHDNNKMGQVTICDINQHMLDVGKARAESLGWTEEKLKNIKINWVCADAERLNFENDSFSAYTIAFGVRNCTHIEKVLSEAYRVLERGGRFMCLEFSHLNNSYLQWLYDQYSFQVIPPMGQILAGQWDAYQYLVESIRKFPKQEQFKEMIEQAGFSCVQYENLNFGMMQNADAVEIFVSRNLEKSRRKIVDMVCTSLLILLGFVAKFYIL